MPVDIKPFDAAEYLHSEEDMSEYLLIAMEEAKDWPRLLGHSIGVASRARGGMDVLAQETGVEVTELKLAASLEDEQALPTLRKVQEAYARLAQTRLVA